MCSEVVTVLARFSPFNDPAGTKSGQTKTSTKCGRTFTDRHRGAWGWYSCRMRANALLVPLCLTSKIKTVDGTVTAGGWGTLVAD